MARDQSRLLQLVVAGLLLVPVTDATATTYDDEPISAVTGSGYFGGSSTTYDYYGGYTDLVLNDFDYSQSGGGSGGDGGDSTSTVESAELCNAISALAPVGCDLRNPPLQTVNGCGGGMFVSAVPDYLIASGMPILRLGPVFAQACNEHDRCYGTYLFDKEKCDEKLAVDMIASARIDLSDFQWILYGHHVRTQAAFYSTALQTPPILSVANGLFASAQASGACRAFGEQAKEMGCFD